MINENRLGAKQWFASINVLENIFPHISHGIKSSGFIYDLFIEIYTRALQPTKVLNSKKNINKRLNAEY